MTTEDIDGKVVVVTGANEGIGYHMLRTLLSDGYRVAGLDIAGDQLGPLADRHPDRVRYYDCDVTVDEDVEAAVADVVESWGGIDILVNNAALFHFGLFADRTLEQTREEFEVNYFGYLRTIRAVLPQMRERGEGIIHNVSSGVSVTGHPGLSGYASTKGAIDGLTRSLQLELQDVDVACTIMYPALANTRSAAELGYPESMLADPADVGRKLARQIESTDEVIMADWKTRLGLFLSRRLRVFVRRGTRRFLDPETSPAGKQAP